jgi:hypothetical protein
MKRVLLGLLALFLAVTTTACGGDSSSHEGEIQLPASSSAYVGEHFDIAVDELESAGFTNVETKALGDLITGWLKSDGEVEKIRIDGNESFSKGDWFPAETKILIIYHSFPEEDAQEEQGSEQDEPDSAASSALEPTTQVPEPTTQTESTSLSDAERSMVLEQHLREIFGGVSSMSELLTEMPTDWPGYVVGVRVEGSLAYFTLQVDGNTADGARLGQDAAQALSTLLSAEDVAGIDWIIVEDGAGVVIDQKQPNPNY